MAITSQLKTAPREAEVIDTPPVATSNERRGPMRPSRLVSTRARLSGLAVARTFRVIDALVVIASALAVRVMTGDDVAQSVLFAASMLLIGALTVFRAYEFGRRETLAVHLSRLAIGMAVAAGLATAMLFPFIHKPGFSAALLAWTPATLAILAALHGLWWGLVRHWRACGRLTPNIVVVGATGAATRLVTQALRRGDVNVLGVFEDRKGRAPGELHGVPMLGDTDTLVAHRIMPFVDRIVLTVPAQAKDRVAEMIARLRVLPNEIVLLLDGQSEGYEAAAISRIADVPLAHVCGPPTDQMRAAVKRTQDVVVGMLALIIAAPVMALIALAVRLDSPGPALFRQRRHGFNNEEIVVWKFRSMRVETADATARRQVSVGDDRVTRVGNFIRCTSLDELPQIFNVLSGEMSLVGPRPHAVGMRTGEVESARLVAEYAHRHRMKPGMTGWAAIHGSRGPVDTPELVRRRVELDVEYIERQSFWLDLYIMAMTIPCLLGDRHAVR